MQKGVALLAFAIAGCGFRNLQPGDTDLAGTDLAGVDFAGVDFSGGAVDMSIPTGGVGPGPLGALPAGFCCANNEECRSRFCDVGHCSDECGGNSDCQGWAAQLTCNTTTGRCVAPTGFTCLDPSTYHYGTKAIGACCAHGFNTAGQECLGGLCTATGADANPFYCTQGCNANTHCPGGYSCFNGFCWITQTISDLTFMYTCN